MLRCIIMAYSSAVSDVADAILIAMPQQQSTRVHNIAAA